MRAPSVLLHRPAPLIDAGSRESQYFNATHASKIVSPLSQSWGIRPRPTTRSPTLCKNSAPAKSSDLTFPTRCWWWPVHHTQLCIWISNPEGAKEPPFVILDKQKSAVRQGLVFKGAKGLDGCHPALILSSGDFMLQMQDDNGAQGETN